MTNRMTVKLALLFIVCLQAMLASGQPGQREQSEPQEPPEVHHFEIVFFWAPTAIAAEELNQNQELPLARMNFGNYLRGRDHAFLVLGLRAFHFEEELGFEVSSRTSNCEFNPDWNFFQEADPDQIRSIMRLDANQNYWPNIFEDNREDLYQWEWVMTV